MLVCDRCMKPVEGCEEVAVNYKHFNLGDGRCLPDKDISRVFCSLACLKEWLVDFGGSRHDKGA